jgi:hypothetical protein
LLAGILLLGICALLDILIGDCKALELPDLAGLDWTFLKDKTSF